MIAPQLFSQTVSTQNSSSANDSIMQQFFSTCLPDESYRVVSGTSQVSTIPDPLPPQSRPTYQHPPQSQDDYKMVYWLHGFRGNDKSWRKPAKAFDRTGSGDVIAPRLAVCNSEMDYSTVSDFGLYSVAQTVGEFMVDRAANNTALNPNGWNTYDRSQSIVIAHSQGGIVTREIDRQQSTNEQFELRFGGLVTFNSPNQGAIIADSEQQDIMLAFLEDFSSDVIAGPIAAKIFEAIEFIIELIPEGLQYLINTVPDFPTGEEIGDKLSSFIIEDIFSFYLDESLPQITKEYTPDAEELEDLNTYQSDMTSILAIASERPVVTYIDGVEIESDNGTNTVNDFPVPISWATLNFFINNLHDFDLFEADKSEPETAIQVENVRLEFIAKKSDYEQKLNNLEIERSNARLERDRACGGLFGWANPICWSMRTKVANLNDLVDKNHSVVDGYELGINAFNNFNNNYLTAMGLRELDQTIEEEQYCICFSGTGLEETRTGPFPPGTTCIPQSSNGPGGFGQQGFCYSIIEEVVTNNWTILPSDGLFSVEVQSNIPQATEDAVIISRDNPRVWSWSEINENSRVDYGSTHMAIRNDDIGKNALIKLFDGDFGFFFEINEVE